MKTVRKLTAIILVFIIFICVPSEALANVQNPISVNGMGYINSTSDTDTFYSFSLVWQKPTIAVAGDQHHPAGYYIYYRNASTGETYKFDTPYDIVRADQTGGPDNLNYPINNLRLDGGSLYTFMIVPYHTHVTVDPEDPTNYISTEVTASRANPPTPELLYLSDISVSGYGTEGDSSAGVPSTMTITWDNPTLAGVQLFDTYRIYYNLGGDTLGSMPKGTYVDVKASDAIRIDNGKRLEYTFNIGGQLIPGAFYAVSVEPMLNGKLFRAKEASQADYIVTIDGASYVPAFTPFSREFRTSVPVSIPIYVKPVGGGLLEISWATLVNNGSLKSVEIQTCDDEYFNPPNVLGTLAGTTSALEITHWLTDMPTKKMYYRIWITYEFVNSSGEVTTYGIPSVVESYDPNYDDFLPYTPTVTHFNGSGTPVTLDVTWEAFLREPYNNTESENVRSEVNLYLDDYLDYYVLITDSLAALDLDAYPPYSIVDPINAHTSLTPVFNASTKKFYYSQQFTHYYTINESGLLDTEQKLLEENKIYYVRIIAVRNNTDEYRRSNYSYASTFVPPSGDISVTPQMAAKPPFKIEDVTTTSITTGWDRKWFEAYNAEDGNWYALIGWNSDGELLFGDDATTSENKYTLYGAITDFADSSSPLDVLRSNLSRTILATTQLSETQVDAIIGRTPFRFVDLGINALYEMHVTTFEDMKKVGTYEEYLTALLQPTSTAIWTPAQPFDPDSTAVHPRFTIANLQPNTPYVIFFRPYYMMDGVKHNACYPIHLSATTLSIRDPLEIKPIIPLLEPNGETDMSVSVKWEYTPELIYEISFSETLAQYSEGGIKISFESILENAEMLDPEEEGGKAYLGYEITSLFPDSSYYVWIRSGNGTLYSEWSNPIMMTTLDILPPDPPKGLGLVSNDNISAFNSENALDLSRIDMDYMIIEWMKDYKDRSENAASNEFPEVLLSPSFTDSYVARVSELEPNREYYIRIKTILTVSRTGDGLSEQNYNYYVQVARDQYFDDLVGAGYVPALAVETPDPYNDRRKESDWCVTLMVKTGKSKAEYDSDVDDKTYPLPLQDFEVSFDAASSTLNLRFRTNQTDAAGNRDNSVDQRFISSLIANQTGLYVLDLSTYNNQTVANGTVELPYSIVTAFDERKIPLRLKMSNLTVDFMPGSLNTPEVMSLKDYGRQASVKISVMRNPGNAPALSPGEGYASNPQNISVQVTSPSQSFMLGTLSNQMNVSMDLNGNYSTLESNIGAYYADGNSGGWQRLDADYTSGTGAGAFNFRTTKLANYSAIAHTLPTDTEVAKQSDASYNIMTRLDIRDMQSYKGSEPITANQLNNLIAAIAKGSTSLNINDSMSREDYESLGKSGYLITGTTVRRQVAMNALVRLYELKTKTAIKSFSSQRESPYKDIALAEQQYRDVLLKAGDLGFYGTNADSDPNALLTISDALYIIDIIMGDAGM